MSDVDRDTPTPRLTFRWLAFAQQAKELADRLRTAELEARTILEPVRQTKLYRLRQVADWYQQAFGRWERETVPFEQKHQELTEFEAFRAYCKVVGV